MKNVELLSPAGSLEKLKTAVSFGADAVYLSGKDFGLRAKASNFGLSELEDAFRFLHKHGKKGYVTVNTYPRNKDFETLPYYLGSLKDIGADAIIVSDPGVFLLLKKLGINIPVHISTQANVVNYMTVDFWKEAGASRIILARELSRAEIDFIVRNCNIDIEMFVHGAMCISHSGRCVLSNYFTGKDANSGECTHPCRWKYHLVEETRPGEYLPVVENDEGSFIYNSKDLCLIDYISDIIDLGVKSLKIEGRMKSAMYTGVVTGVYRKAVDECLTSGSYKPGEKMRNLLGSVSNRGYTTGFYTGDHLEDSMNYSTSAYFRNCDFIGIVQTQTDDYVKFLCKSKMSIGDTLHFLNTDLEEIKYKVEEIYDEKYNGCEYTKPNYEYYLPVNFDLSPGSFVRRYK